MRNIKNNDMEGKKSFILYCDLINTVEKLPDDKAGQLFKIILNYVNDNNPVIDDILLDVTFEPIRQQFKRDLDSWNKTKAGRSKAGKASAEKRRLMKLQEQQDSTNSTNVNFVQHDSTNSTVTVNDNVTVNVNDTKINKGKPLNLDEVVDYFKDQNILHPEKNAADFYHHYEANGWMRGKSKIKSWKSCVKTWKFPKQQATEIEQKKMTPQEEMDYLRMVLKRDGNG